MKKQTITLERFLYILIFLVALGIRVIGLGKAPLSDYEADHAVRAFQIFQGDSVELGTQPGYVLLTGLAFFVLGSNDATARLWPVVAGSLMVFLPFLLRDRIGRKAALVAAFGLALDPGLVVLSQVAGGPGMAISFALLAIATWINGWTIAAGISAGLALLSGPSVIAGGLGLAITAGVARLVGLFPVRDGKTPEESAPSPIEGGMTSTRAGLLAAGGTLLLAGTLFLRYPQGLSAFAAALPVYFEGWAVPSSVAASRLLIPLGTYPLVGVVFGVIAIVRAWASSGGQASTGRLLSLWLGVSLVLALAYPGRQVADLAWTLIPLWGLAGLELSRYLQEVGDGVVSWALAGLVVVMLASVWTNLGGLASSNAQGQVLLLRWLVIGGAILLAVLSAVLVGLGWSGKVAKHGLAWGTTIALGIGMLANVWSATQRDGIPRLEIWKPVPGTGYQGLLLQTLGDLGDWTVGREDSLQIISLVDTPSLRWALRKLPNVYFQDGLNRNELPEAIITLQDQTELSLGTSYRGQDFVWWLNPNWDAWTGLDWLKWLAFREVTGVQQQEIIVWGRGDLFPSGEVVLEPPVESDLTGIEEEFIPEEEFLEREEPLK